MIGRPYLFILLLLFGGCSAMPTVAVRMPLGNEPAEQNEPARQNEPVKQNEPVSVIPVATPAPAAQPPTRKEEPAAQEDEPLLESEETHQITEAEQAELLAQNIWVKNLAMINALDAGKRPMSGGQRINDRQRRDEINNLNLSEKDLAKKKNQRFEYADGTVSDWRWMHRGVDKLGAVSPEHRVSPEVFLRNNKYKGEKYKILRANAAILLGRDGNDSVTKYLLQLVKNEAADVRLRCAAAEVLGRMKNVTLNDLLPLIDTVKEQDKEVAHPKTGEMTRQHFPGVTEIWSELLTAAAEKGEPWNHPCFLEPLTASSSEMRYEAAKIWRRYSVQATSKNIF